MGGGHWFPNYALTRILLNLLEMDFFFFHEYTVTRERLWVLFCYSFVCVCVFLSSSVSETVIKHFDLSSILSDIEHKSHPLVCIRVFCDLLNFACFHHILSVFCPCSLHHCLCLSFPLLVWGLGQVFISSS